MNRFLAIIVMGFMASVGSAQSMTKVEPLTKEQQARIEKAREAIAKAQRDLVDIQTTIAVEHKMKSETWMEWQTYVEFDGDFIVLRYHNSMTN